MKDFKSIYFLGGIALFFLFSRFLITGHAEEQKMESSSGRPIVAAWLPGWSQTVSFGSLKNNAEVFDEIMPFWYDMNVSGEVVTVQGKDDSGVSDEEVLDFCKKNGIKVIPLISNEFNPFIVHKVINDEGLRKKHIENIKRTVIENNYDGIEIDYENLLGRDRDSFSLFIEELASALHKENKVLAIAVHPKTSCPGTWDGPISQDWDRIGKSVDEARIMTYDCHWSSSEAGAIAELPWVEEVVSFAVTKIPKEKIMLGVPNYGYDWIETWGKGVHYEDVTALVKQHNAEIKWDDRAKAPYFEYDENGVKRQVWFENEKSVVLKMDIAKKYGIKGVAVWVMSGRENPEFWKTINNELKKMPR